MKKNIFCQRTTIVPWACTYDTTQLTLTGMGNGGSLPYTYAPYVAGDRLWLVSPPTQQVILVNGVSDSGYDDRFDGLYLVLDAGSDSPGRNWKLRRDPELDSTEKYQECPNIFFMDDPVNPAPSWSKTGSMFTVFLLPFFQMDVTSGPLVTVQPTPGQPGAPH